MEITLVGTKAESKESEMAVGKEILTKIRSVQNTQKITKAMQMVSTSKMRKTQERMRLARPYADKVRLVMNHLAKTSEYHGLSILESREEIKRVGFILITTDKGLCGGLNANLLKKFFAQVQEYQSKGVEVQVVCLGSKGLAACQRVGLNVVASVTNLGDTPKMTPILGAITEFFTRYSDGDLDVVHLAYSGFINTMKQEARSEVLLPIGKSVLEENSPEADKYNWDYHYEPDPLTVLEYLARRDKDISSCTSCSLVRERSLDSSRWQNRRWSKSSPPKAELPPVALTSNSPLESCNTDTSNVPPPKS